MADDMGDKTEAPTPKRRSEARANGNIARSPDLTAACLLIGFMVLLKYYGPDLVSALKLLVQQMLSANYLTVDLTQINTTIINAVILVGQAMAPLFIGIMLIAIGANLAQVGLFFNTKKLQPNFAALNPFKGLGRIFGGGKGGVQLLMNAIKMSLVAFAAYSAIHGRLGEIVSVQQLSFIQIFGIAAQIIYSISIRIGIILLVLALLDFGWQKFRHEKELKMSKQEVKEEMRSMDGDPKIKARRRQIQMAMARERLKQDVPKADVVVTNPTHYAVALKYDQGNMHAPRVVAKGEGFMALKIREIAIAHGVPILERKPLARALFRLCDVGQEIPEEFYSAVAEILAYVYELSGKAKQQRAAAALQGA